MDGLGFLGFLGFLDSLDFLDFLESLESPENPENPPRPKTAPASSKKTPPAEKPPGETYHEKYLPRISLCLGCDLLGDRLGP